MFSIEGIFEAAPLAKGVGVLNSGFGRWIGTTPSFSLAPGHPSSVTPSGCQREKPLFYRSPFMQYTDVFFFALRQTDKKYGYYLSMEFLQGRALLNAIENLELETEVKDALAKVCALELRWQACSARILIVWKSQEESVVLLLAPFN